MRSPYVDLPKRQFWRTGVAEQNVLTVIDLYKKKFEIGKEDRIASAGSCFAQHISRRLMDSGYTFLDMEPPPSELPINLHAKFGYSTYSARYGNIYTTSQLLQLAEEAFELRPSLDYSWEKEGRYYDPLRPNVEPDGLGSHEELMVHRRFHLSKVRELLNSCDLFVFTLGLTEAWVCRKTGRILPTAPGTIAGDYDPEKYAFVNLTHAQIKEDLIRFMQLVHKVQNNKSCKFLLTVSPVPLTATATNNHVLVATTHSKSTLRSVAAELYDEFDNVDYVPSYEVISSTWSRGLFFESNLRSIASAGVDAAMRIFFLEHESASSVVNSMKADEERASRDGQGENEDVVCEEALLEGFAK